MKMAKYLGMAIILAYFFWGAMDGNWPDIVMMGVVCLTVLADGKDKLNFYKKWDNLSQNKRK